MGFTTNNLLTLTKNKMNLSQRLGCHKEDAIIKEIQRLKKEVALLHSAIELLDKMKFITTKDNTEWAIDDNNNRCSFKFFGGRKEAIKALKSLDNCTNCVNCNNCHNCHDCYYCHNCYHCRNCYDYYDDCDNA